MPLRMSAWVISGIMGEQASGHVKNRKLLAENNVLSRAIMITE